MQVARFDPADPANEPLATSVSAPLAFDVVKESGNAAAAAGASFGVLVGSMMPAPVLGPTLGAAIGFGIGRVIGRAFARRESSTAVERTSKTVDAQYFSFHDD